MLANGKIFVVRCSSGPYPCRHFYLPFYDDRKVTRLEKEVEEKITDTEK